MTMMPNVIQFQPKAASAELRRPRLIARAARAGIASYRRGRDLRRILRCDELPSAEAVLRRLRLEEEALEQARIEARTDYDLKRHILLLVAILAEYRGSQSSPVTFPGRASRARP